jgi:hypothetical protein
MLGPSGENAAILDNNLDVYSTIYFFGSRKPTSRRQDWDWGIGIGGCQVRLGRVERVGSSWGEEIRRARRPWGTRRRAATGRISARRSTARRVTTSKVHGGRVWARTFCILMSVNVRARATSRRKVAFFWFDSIRVREIFGAQSFMGMPGKPAPEPRSATRASAFGLRASGGSKAFTAEGAEDAEELLGNRWRAAKRLSPKWRVTISSSLRMAVRLMREFQWSSRSTYVDIWFSCDGERRADFSPGLRPGSE